MVCKWHNYFFVKMMLLYFSINWFFLYNFSFQNFQVSPFWHPFRSILPSFPRVFPIQNNLYSAVFSPIILFDFPLNLVSCTRQMSTELHSNISIILLTHLWESPHLLYQLVNLQTFLGNVVAVWQCLHLTIIFQFVTSALWKVWFINTFCHFINSDLARWGWRPIFLSRHHL